MKRLITLCVFTLMVTASLFAQDIIVTNDAQKIEAKILEVSKSEIKYKEKSNLNGPTFILETKEISSIIYANGKVVLYNQQTSENQKLEEAPSVQETSSNIAEANDYNAEIVLLSGQVIKGKLMEIADNYVAYTYNAKYFTMPASQVEYVKDLRDGKITKYLGAPLDSKTQVSTTPKYVSRNGNTYYYDGRAMNEQSYSEFLQNNCPAAYDKFHSGSNIAYAGWIFFSAGIGLDFGSLIGFLISGRSSANTAFSLIGLGFEIACIPTLIVGYNKKHNSVDVYNTNCAKRSTTKAYWSVNASQNGIGLAYNF